MLKIKFKEATRSQRCTGNVAVIHHHFYSEVYILNNIFESAGNGTYNMPHNLEIICQNRRERPDLKKNTRMIEDLCENNLFACIRNKRQILSTNQTFLLSSKFCPHKTIYTNYSKVFAKLYFKSSIN